MFEGYPTGGLTAPGFGFPATRGYPRLRQIKEANASDGANNITLDLTPKPGSVLIAGFGTQQAGTISISGGGATWLLQAAQQDSGTGDGAQFTHAFWVGRVTGTPSTSVTITVTNAGAYYVAEFEGLLGEVLGVDSAKAFQTALSKAHLVGPRGALGIWAAWTRGAYSSAVPWATSGMLLQFRSNQGLATVVARVHPGGRHQFAMPASASNHSLIAALIR